MIDVIAKGETVTRVTEEGSLRRCGGQGDVVAGVMGVMNLWSTRTVMDMPSGVVAATATSQIIRRAASRASASATPAASLSRPRIRRPPLRPAVRC